MNFLQIMLFIMILSFTQEKIIEINQCEGEYESMIFICIFFN